MTDIYFNKYLKYKSKYKFLQRLRDLFKTKNWPEIIKSYEKKYNNAVSELQKTQTKLKDLIIEETNANTNYYNDVSNKKNEKVLADITTRVDKKKKQVKKLEELVLKTNKEWKDSIVKASEARVEAAQKDVDEAKDNILKNKKEVLMSSEALQDAQLKQRKAEGKLQKHQTDEGLVKNQLDITVKNLEKVRLEEADNLTRLGSSSALAGISSETFQAAELQKGEKA
jgi:hypothetical protein